MKILVVGYFGYRTNQIDGQTIKTRDVYKLIYDKLPEKTSYFDTQSLQYSKLSLFEMMKMIVQSDVIFYLPAQNNLKYLFPIISILTKFSKTKINYLVVGGWLHRFLEKKPVHRYLLSNIDGIYTETDDLLKGLSEYEFKNVKKLHNFRVVDYSNIKVKKKIDDTIRLVFMARVHPLKGINVLFELDRKIKDLEINNVTIDIYGPIFEPFKKSFYEMLSSSSYISYKGIIEPSNIYNVLTDYDLMLFPTKYFTEGFPGSILDAYISGLPVVASNWLNAKEFIEDGITGYIVDFNNDDIFINKTLELVRNSKEIRRLQKFVIIKRNEYSSASAWDIIKQSL